MAGQPLAVLRLLWMCRAVTFKEVTMKRYTGNLVIELEDQNTGVKETVSETNMVTNAVNDIL
jgi:hypothetical protein